MNPSPFDAMTSDLHLSNNPIGGPQNPTAQPILTVDLIKADNTCMTSQHIVPLLESIWEYTSTWVFLPITPIEVAAGHRYWLPNSLLAEEWMMVFIFVPRLLGLAPLEVRTAFEEQLYNVDGHWPCFAEFMSVAEHLSQHGYPRPEQTRSAGDGTANSMTGPLPVPSSGFTQSHTAPLNLAVQRPPPPISAAPQLLPPVQPIQPAQPVQPGQQVSQGHVQLAFALAPGPHPNTVPVPSVSVFPLQSVPDGSAAFEQNPAAPPVFNQLLQAKGINIPGFRPGSVLPTDNGNKAWSAERIRAFVEIEHKSIHQLPPTAFSPLGTEMSNFRTPESINVTLCPFETSLEENFTYFSNICTLNRHMCLRAIEHWLPMQIARYINYVHDLQTPKIFGRSKIGHHFAKAKEWGVAHPTQVPTASLRHTSTDSGARGPNRILHDYFLHSMGDGVVRTPHGRKAQMLTRVIDHVRNVTGDRNVRLSEAAVYAQRWNITVPTHQQMDFQNLTVEDQLPSEAFLEMIKDDYRSKFNGEDP